jgi:hypothetical protein
MSNQGPGFMSRSEAIDRCAARTGFDLEKIACYHIFGQFKMAAFLQQIDYRYHNGQTRDKRFEHFGAFSKALIHVAHERAQSTTWSHARAWLGAEFFCNLLGGEPRSIAHGVETERRERRDQEQDFDRAE